MKNRILSCVLAMLMLASMVTVFAFSSSAETEATFTITVGNTVAAPGSTAVVPLFVSTSGIEDYVGQVNWQVYFSGAQITGQTLYVTGGEAWGKPNLYQNMANGTADAGFLVATATATDLGMACIALIEFAVPAEAAGDIEVAITEVEVLQIQKTDGTQPDLCQPEGADIATITTVPGTIKVAASVDSYAEAVEGAGEAYAVPYGVTSLFDEDDNCMLTGEFSVLTLPASITTYEDAFGDVDAVASIIVKNTQLEKADATAMALGSSADPTKIYIHKRVDGTDTTADAFASMTNKNKQKVSVANILTTLDTTRDGSDVYFVGAIAVDDLDYTAIKLVVTRGDGKTYETTSNMVATSLYTGKGADKKILVTTDGAVAEAAEITAADATYLTGLKLTGVPADQEVTVVIYGQTKDATGNLIWVCSNEVTVTV